MLGWLAKLQTIDRRWLYLATVVLLIVPFVVAIPMPPGSMSPATMGLYEAVDSCPSDKVVLVDSSWDMGSQAENYAQLECVVRHLCRKGIRFVVTSVGVTKFGPSIANDVIRRIASEEGRQYGRDWVILGYVEVGGNIGAVIDGLCRDLHRICPADFRGTPVGELLLMQSVRSIRDVHLIYCITYSPPSEWISMVRGQHGTLVAFGCMSIMAPNYFMFIDSGQLCGMLVGNRGAAEYEARLGEPGQGTKLIMVASFGNGIIVLAALLGNIGQWAAKRGKRRPQ
jgi:hypothetical protein